MLGDEGALGPRFRCELVASELAQWSDDHDEALARASTALELARADGDPRLIADALRRRGMAHIFQGEHRAARRRSASRSRPTRQRRRDRDGVGASESRGCLHRGSHGRRRETAARRLESFERAGDLAGKGWSTGLLAYVRIYDGRFTEADELARQTLLDAREQGDRWTQGMMNVRPRHVGALERSDRRRARACRVGTVANFPEGADSVGVVQALAREVERSCGAVASIRAFSCS